MNKSALKKYMSEIGKKGGAATATRGPEYYSKIGKAGMKKRWGTVDKTKKKLRRPPVHN